MTAPQHFDRPSKPLRRCEAQGCQRMVPGHLLMCIEHWRMVPAPAARLVLQTWRVRSRGDAYDLNYQDAVRAAVEAVAAKQAARSGGGASAPGAAGVSGDLFADPA